METRPRHVWIASRSDSSPFSLFLLSLIPYGLPFLNILHLLPLHLPMADMGPLAHTLNALLLPLGGQLAETKTLLHLLFPIESHLPRQLRDWNLHLLYLPIVLLPLGGAEMGPLYLRGGP